MQHVLTLFDYTCYPPLPLQSIVVGEDIKFYTFYIKGTGVKIKQIWEAIEEFKAIFETPTCVNDFKSHIQAFNLDRHVEYDVYDMNIPSIKFTPQCEDAGKRFLAKVMSEFRGVRFELWNRLFANASVVYQTIEDNGVRDDYKRLPVIYSLDTYTGRSKTLRYSVQGATEECDIKSVREANEVLVHFDWIAADMRMAAVMSGDQDMLDSYKESDPYTRMAEYLNDPQFPRDKCKTQFLKAIYSLNIDNPVLDFYPIFKQWMRDRLGFMRRECHLDTIMGRKFSWNKDNELSVFNSQFQGSVAHAMQAALTKLFVNYRNNILVDMHDSVVMSCSESMLKGLIDAVVPIMTDPLNGCVDQSPFMPLKVSVGTKWKQWQKLREYRE